MVQRNSEEEPGVSDRREQRICARVAQLLACDGDYGRIDAAQAAKRTAWWEAHRETLALTGSLPRQAYSMFFLEYLGLDPAEVPVVYEDEWKIIWRSYNFCPTLSACLRLGLDTREVCSGGTERSAQDFISLLDPRLRFGRNYTDGIRPHAPYCEESIELVS